MATETNFDKWWKCATPQQKKDYWARRKRAREMKRDPEKTIAENRKRLMALYGR